MLPPRETFLLIMLDVVVECVDEAKLTVDRASQQVAVKEHIRTTSAPRR